MLSGTVPPFDTAHRVLRISGWSEMPRFLHRTVPTNTNNFCVVYDYSGKANIRKGCWNPKRKLGVTTYFSEIINLKFEKKMPHIVLYFKVFFLQLWLLLSNKLSLKICANIVITCAETPPYYKAPSLNRKRVSNSGSLTQY